MIKILLALFLVIQLPAEEKKEEAPAEGAASTANSADQKATKELMEVEKQVGALAAKIKAKSDSVELLLRQKSVERDPEKLAEIVKLVQQEHKELDQLTRDYNTQLGILKYRFPERGMIQGRRYQRLNTRSLEDMEKTLGLDAHLKKSRDKVKTVYGVKDQPAPKKKQPSHKDPNEGEELLNPSILSK